MASISFCIKYDVQENRLNVRDNNKGLRGELETFCAYALHVGMHPDDCDLCLYWQDNLPTLPFQQFLGLELPNLIPLN